MAIYSQGFNTSINTSGAPNADIKASTVNSPRIMELALNMGAVTASSYGIGRPGNDGSVVQSSGTALIAENPNDPTANTTTAVAWTTAPTVPTTFLRRVSLPSAIGAGVIWTFPRGLILAATKGVVIWNNAANTASLNVWVVADE